MEYGHLKQDNGVAGLTVLLSLVTFLFVIGLLVMIFSLMGSGLQDASYETTIVAVAGENVSTVTNTSFVDFAVSGYRDVVCAVTLVSNLTGNEVITASNYTVSGCSISSIDAGPFNGTEWNVTYSYTWSADTQATDVMNDTTTNISGVTDWFNIFIVIAAMVVLILLTVIIITAIKGSGLMGAKSSGDQNKAVGSA